MFNRNENFGVDTKSYRRPEFAHIDQWLWTEKLDGSNISIAASKFGTTWRGRTPNSQFNLEIVNHLNLRVEAWTGILDNVLNENKLDSIEFFGEVFGPNIQNGQKYASTINTKFFDIRVDQRLWLDWNTCREYSRVLGYEMPAFGLVGTNALVDMVREGFPTKESRHGGWAEGIVAKTPIPLYNNNNDRLIWKLKTKDFD